MPSPHPNPSELHGYVCNRLSSDLHQRIQRHLLVCEACEEHYLRLAFQADAELDGSSRKRETLDPEAPYHHVIDRVLARTHRELARQERALCREQELAPALLEEILALPEDQRLGSVERASRFHTWRLCELILEESHRRAFDNPRLAIALARLAVAIAERIDERQYGTTRARDLQGRAWAWLGNTYRIVSDFQRAEQAFATAAEHLAQGSGDPQEEAHLLGLRSSLRRLQRRFDDAIDLLEEALALYRLLRAEHLAGRTLIKLGIAYGYSERSGEAVRAIREGLALIDPKQEPGLDFYARHNLICFLLDAGRLLEAQALFAETRRQGRELYKGILKIRLRWLEARLACALGRPGEAEAALRDARDGFIEEGIGLDAALVSLELAALYARSGRLAEIKRLAEEMVPIFRSRDIHREALAALILFQQAAQREQATCEVVQQVAARIRGHGPIRRG